MSCSYSARGRIGGRGRMGWRPLELVAMILGFMIFWPIGLAILGLKFWQAKSGFSGDFGAFAQQKWGDFENRAGFGGGFGDFRPFRASGNSAFDEWREAELARILEARKKLADAEREFEDYLEGLRRAKDREDFERFMANRGAGA